MSVFIKIGSLLSFILPQTYIVDRYQKKVVSVASAKNSSLENVGERAHHSGVCQKLVKAALGPIENLEIVTSQAKDPPIVRNVVITRLCNGPSKESLVVEEIKAKPTSNKNKGMIYLGVNWASLKSG